MRPKVWIARYDSEGRLGRQPEEGSVVVEGPLSRYLIAASEISSQSIADFLLDRLIRPYVLDLDLTRLRACLDRETLSEEEKANLQERLFV